MECREVDDAAKLSALRDAARIELAAFDSGDFKEFADVSALVDHLDQVGNPVVADSRDAP